MAGRLSSIVLSIIGRWPRREDVLTTHGDCGCDASALERFQRSCNERLGVGLFVLVMC